MKKLCSVCAAACVLTSMLSAYALPAVNKTEPTIVAMTFDDVSTNNSPYGISTSEMIPTIKQPDLKVKNKVVEAVKKAPVGYMDIGLMESSDKMGFSFDLMLDAATIDRQIKVVDQLDNETVAFTIQPDGTLVSSDGRVLRTLKMGKWYSFDLMYRFSANRYDIYMDGKCLQSDCLMPNYQKFDAAKRLRFWANGGGYDSKICIDNIHIYKGKKILGNEGLKSSFNAEVMEAAAEESAAVDETSISQNAEFDNEEIGALPGSMFQAMNIGENNPGSKVEIAAVPDETNRSLHIYKSEKVTTPAGLDFEIDISNAHYAHIEFKFKEEKVSSNAAHTILLRSENPAWTNLVKIQNSGKMVIADTVEKDFTVDQWHEMHFLLNCREMRYEKIELDGEVVAENLPYPDRTAVSPSVVRMTTEKLGEIAASLYIDDFRVYAGKERRDAAELNEATANVEFSRLITPEGVVKPWLEKAVSMVTLSDKVTSHTERLKLPVSAQEIDGMVYAPVAFVAEAFGSTATTNPDGTVTVTANGKTAVFPARMVEGVALVNAEELAAALDVTMTFSEQFCLVVFDAAKQNFTYEQLEDIFDYTMYERPKAANFLEVFKNSGMSGVHPRVLATKEEFDIVREAIKTDPTAKRWFEELLAQAEDMMANSKPPVFAIDDLKYAEDHYLGDARNSLHRIILMSLLYQLTGDTKYPEWMWREVKTWTDFKMWYGFTGGTHLATGEIGPGISIAYDWCYDYWTQEQRDIMTSALCEEAFWMFESGYDYSISFTSSWMNNENNINLVVNGGAGVTALALLDIYPERAAKILENAVLAIENGLITYVPSGATLEGPSYWDYQTTYLCWMMKTMLCTLGTDFGYITENPFLKRGSRYYTYMQSRQGVNNVADAGSENQQSSEVFWLAKVFDDRDLARAIIDERECNQMDIYALDLLFYDPEFTKEQADLPLDLIYGDQALLHNEYHTQDSIYVSMHSGKNDSTHGNVDAGTFLLDALGVRWARELGHDYYQQTLYWDFRQRGYLYKLGPQGQNIIALNPTIELGQVWNAKADFTQFETASRGGFAVVDLTEAYGTRVNSAQRGIKLDTDRSQIVVQDEMDLKGENDLYWFMHTQADMEVSKDGKSAILKQDGKTLYAVLQTNLKNAKFSAAEEVPLEGSGVKPSYWSLGSNAGRLQIHAPKAKGKATIAVRFIPMVDQDVPENLSDIPVAKMQPIRDWKAEEGEYVVRPFVDSITIDGKPIANFSKRVNEYLIEYPYDIDPNYLPKVEAVTQNEDAVVAVTQADSLEGMAVISVTSTKDTTKSRTYKVSMTVMPWCGIPEGRVERKPVGYEASYQANPNKNGIANAFDGLNTTFFSNGPSGVWVMADLGSVQHVDVVSVNTYHGGERRNFFDIQVSTDAKNWKTVFADGTSGKVADYENIDIGDQQARYVRLVGRGHSNGPECSYIDIKFYGKD